MIIVILLGLKAVGGIFGSHFLEDIRSLARREFTTLSGLISFVTTLAFVFLAYEPRIMGLLTSILSPRLEMTTADGAGPAYWGAFGMAIANFALLAILSNRSR